jgi:hypothetical protein
MFSYTIAWHLFDYQNSCQLIKSSFCFIYQVNNICKQILLLFNLKKLHKNQAEAKIFYSKKKGA